MAHFVLLPAEQFVCTMPQNATENHPSMPPVVQNLQKLRRLLDSGCDWGSTWSFLNCWASSILTLASTWTKRLWIVPRRLNVSGWMLVGWFEWYAPRGTSFLSWVWLFLSHPNSAGLLLLSGHLRTISRGAGELFHLSRGRDAPCLCRETWGNICREPSSSAQFRTCFAQSCPARRNNRLPISAPRDIHHPCPASALMPWVPATSATSTCSSFWLRCFLLPSKWCWRKVVSWLFI